MSSDKSLESANKRTPRVFSRSLHSQAQDTQSLDGVEEIASDKKAKTFVASFENKENAFWSKKLANKATKIIDVASDITINDVKSKQINKKDNNDNYNYSRSPSYGDTRKQITNIASKDTLPRLKQKTNTQNLESYDSFDNFDNSQQNIKVKEQYKESSTGNILDLYVDQDTEVAQNFTKESTSKLENSTIGFQDNVKFDNSSKTTDLVQKDLSTNTKLSHISNFANKQTHIIDANIIDLDQDEEPVPSTELVKDFDISKEQYVQKQPLVSSNIIDIEAETELNKDTITSNQAESFLLKSELTQNQTDLVKQQISQDFSNEHNQNSSQQTNIDLDELGAQVNQELFNSETGQFNFDLNNIDDLDFDEATEELNLDDDSFHDDLNYLDEDNDDLEDELEHMHGMHFVQKHNTDGDMFDSDEDDSSEELLFSDDHEPRFKANAKSKASSSSKSTALVKSSPNSIGYFIKAANQVPLLSEEEELELARRLRNFGDMEAARKLVMSHLRLVVSVARGYTGYGLPLSDLIQEGNIGLMKAVKHFEPEMGGRLAAFAVHWIKAEIHDYVIRNWRMVKVATTKAQRKLFFKLRQNKKHLGWFTENERKEVASDLGVSPHEVAEMEKRLAGADIGFDLGEDSSDSEQGGSVTVAPSAYLEDENSNFALAYENSDFYKWEMKKLYEALNQLDDRSRYILQRRWLDEKKATLQELSLELKVSIERVRQLESNAMNKVKSMLLNEGVSRNKESDPPKLPVLKSKEAKTTSLAHAAHNKSKEVVDQKDKSSDLKVEQEVCNCKLTNDLPELLTFTAKKRGRKKGTKNKKKEVKVELSSVIIPPPKQS